MTSTPIEARLLGAIVHVYFAIVTLVSIDTNARVASLCIVTSGAILAYVGPQSTFVDVFGTVAASVMCRAVARVGPNAINAATSILTKVTIAVINVNMATRSGEA